MDIRLTDEGEDYGTLEIRLGPDDSFSVGGYARDGIRIRLPLYSHDARELAAILQPLTDRPEVS